MAHPGDPACYRFGRFVLEPERRSLCAGSVQVPLGARAFDILLLLVRHRDRVISKDEILAEVWRGMVVEENNLAVHISALRRALGERPGGDRFIATVSGLGYRFVASVMDATLGGPEISAVPELVARAGTPSLPMIAPKRDFRRVGAMAIGAVLLLTMVLAWIELGRGPSAFQAPRLSIAVLPFRSLGSGQQDYVADAITDDLTTDLSHIPSSTVIARSSAEVFRRRTESATTIGRALDVRYLLAGSLLAEGNLLHMNAQLIDVASGAQLWANAFDVSHANLEDSLAEIVGRISSGLRFTLVQLEGTRSLRERPKNPDALDLYLRARSILDQSNSFSALVAAQDLLEKAVAAAPDYGDALSELGLVLLRKTGDFDDPNEASDFAEAKTIVDRATTVAPENPLAITANGMRPWAEERCRQGVASFQLALSFDPNDMEAHNGLARCERSLGNMTAMISELLATMRVDPLSPSNARREHLIGMGYLMLSKPREAMQWLVRAGSSIGHVDHEEPSLGWENWRHLYLIAATELIGNTAEASELYKTFRDAWPNRTVFQLAAYDDQALSRLPGHDDYLRALLAAGMPLYVSEEKDFGVTPTSTPQMGSDYDPTPIEIPGARRITTAIVSSLMSRSRKPMILDFSPGSHVIPGAISIQYKETEDDLRRTIESLAGDQAISKDDEIITMSLGPFGWESYNAALRLVAFGFLHVAWYRGGEEAWVAAGHSTEDRRGQ